MRKFVTFTLAFFCFIVANATDVTITPIASKGKTQYILDAGAFPNENSALQLKLKLSSLIKSNSPITINYVASRKLYEVKIGPLDSEEEAKIIKNQLAEQNLQEKPPAIHLPDTSNAEKKLWNLRNADIHAVIDEVSRVTGKNFIIDPRVQGKISVVSGAPISNKELYQVFLSMLQVSGYAAIPSGNIIKIVPNIDAKAVSSDALSAVPNPARGDDILVEVIAVHYVPAEQLVPVLRPLMSQWSSVAAYGPSNMLILSGRASNIKRLATIIKQVDSSSANGVDVIILHHALAMDVASTLKELIKTQQSPNSRNQNTIAVDDRSNAILLSGSRTDRIKLRVLIAKLDKENQGVNSGNTQVIYLNYLRAEDLAPILAGVAQANFSGNVGVTIGTITQPALDSTNPASNFASGTSSTPNSNTNPIPPSQPVPPPNSSATPNTTGAGTQNEGSTKPSVQIIAEPNTNSIILNAPSSLIRILKSVINQLDVRPAQLLIEALVAEISEDDLTSLGIEWGTNGRQIGKREEFRPGFAIINSKTSLADFQAQLYALARQHRANILSTPSVVVLDNHQAKILVGKQVSVETSSYPNNAQGTAPSGSPYTTFERVNVALHLYVRPQITRERGIQLQIDQGNDTIDPATIDSPRPIFKVSSIVTSVHIESGDIVVLGGLAQDSLGNENLSLPILGEIPGIGRLFQRNNQNREKRILMVFIRPVILRNERIAVQSSNKTYTNIRETQLDWIRKEEEYDKRNTGMLLPPLHKATLPKPFSRPVTPPIAPMK